MNPGVQQMSREWAGEAVRPGGAVRPGEAAAVGTLAWRAMPETSGYLRHPSLRGDAIAFVTEDDLWSVPAAGGVARRLTANLSEVSHPALSPSPRQKQGCGSIPWTPR